MLNKTKSKFILRFLFSAEWIGNWSSASSKQFPSCWYHYFEVHVSSQEGITQWALNLHKSLGLGKSLGYICEQVILEVFTTVFHCHWFCLQSKNLTCSQQHFPHNLAKFLYHYSKPVLKPQIYLGHFLFLISNIQDLEVAHIRKIHQFWHHTLTSHSLLNISWDCLPTLLRYLEPKPMYRS